VAEHWFFEVGIVSVITGDYECPESVGSSLFPHVVIQHVLLLMFHSSADFWEATK